MSVLSCELVEHGLPIKPTLIRPHKQYARGFNPIMYDTRLKRKLIDLAWHMDL
jgi:hypothetical protein